MSNDIIAELFGEWSQNVNIGSSALKIILGIILSTILGSERARNRHAAGLRTFIVVTLASIMSGIADLYLIKNTGCTFPFIASATVIGISIISTNTILFSSKNQLQGLTTSVVLWAMSIIGVTLGIGLYATAIVGYLALIVSLLLFIKLEKQAKDNSAHFEIHLELKSRNLLQDFIETIRKFGLKIDDIEINPAYANTGLGVYSISLTVLDKDLKNKTHKEICELLKSLECVNYLEEI